MSFYIHLKEPIVDHIDFTVTSYTVVDGFFKAGKWYTPLSNILYMKED